MSSAKTVSTPLRWIHYAVVRRLNDRPFPMDMLAVDACTPVSEGDSFAIRRSEFEPHAVVAVQKFRAEPKAQWHAEEWASRGWVLMPEHYDDLNAARRGQAVHASGAMVVAEEVITPARARRLLDTAAIQPREIAQPLKYLHFAVVEPMVGRGHDCVDMLRYDRAYPATADDGLKLAGGEEFYVCQPLEAARPRFTADRWRSFGCKIKSISFGEYVESLPV